MRHSKDESRFRLNGNGSKCSAGFGPQGTGTVQLRTRSNRACAASGNVRCANRLTSRGCKQQKETSMKHLLVAATVLGMALPGVALAQSSNSSGSQNASQQSASSASQSGNK